MHIHKTIRFLLLIVISACFILGLPACGEGKLRERHIIGHVRSMSADTAVANGTLYMHKTIPNRGLFSHKELITATDSFYTDSNGNFDYTFRASKGTDVAIFHLKSRPGSGSLWEKELQRKDNFYDCGTLYVE